MSHKRVFAPEATGDPAALLVERVAAGDKLALRDLYDRTCARVHGLALQVLRNAPAAEEVVVLVYDQVWRQAARYEQGKGSVESWISTIARTRAIDLRRARQRQVESEPPQAMGLLLDPTPGPLDASHGRERADLVRRALQGLPSDQRRAIEASFFDGLTHAEVARAFGEPLGTVKTRIRTGLAGLRRALATAESP